MIVTVWMHTSQVLARMPWCICVDACLTSACTYAVVQMCGGQRAACRNHRSPLTMWILGPEHGPPCLVAWPLSMSWSPQPHNKQCRFWFRVSDCLRSHILVNAEGRWMLFEPQFGMRTTLGVESLASSFCFFETSPALLCIEVIVILERNGTGLQAQ